MKIVYFLNLKLKPTQITNTENTSNYKNYELLQKTTIETGSLLSPVNYESVYLNWF